MSDSTLIPAVIIFGCMLAVSLIGFVKSFATAVRMDATSQHITPSENKSEEQAVLRRPRH